MASAAACPVAVLRASRSSLAVAAALARGDSGAPAVDEERRQLAAVIRSELLSLEGTPGNRRMVDEHGEMGIKDLLAILGLSDQKSWPKISNAGDTLRAVSERSKSALGVSPPKEGDYHGNFERLAPARRALMHAMYKRYRRVADVGEHGAELPWPLTGLDQVTKLTHEAYESMVSTGSAGFKDVFDVKYVANLPAPVRRWGEKVSFSLPGAEAQEEHNQQHLN